jgi:hypothetical protein|tara:strand:+ start:518 stop:697 length:180 start_codon:yes stop_codon:yes gene_type:complete
MEDGFQPFEILETADPANESSGWTRIAVSADEIAMIMRRLNLSVNYQNVNKFGIFQMCD